LLGQAKVIPFYMVGEQEKKIRTNPTARVSDLLKEVFGKK